jgi:hypothetical protein
VFSPNMPPDFFPFSIGCVGRFALLPLLVRGFLTHLRRCAQEVILMIRNFLSRFMYGRYGGDQLNLFLMGAWLVLFLLSTVFQLCKLTVVSNICYVLAYACIIYGLFRMLSRNYDKRRRENDWYLSKVGPLTHGLRQKRAQLRDKDHRYFHCPSCHQTLRVPKGKGKINVRCRNCGTSFQKKT